jgi:hypothetical protein
MEQKPTVLKKQNQGQSTVEYVLLLAVIMVLVYSVLQSDRFKETLGQDSEIFAAMEKYIEYTYRHGGPGLTDPSTYAGDHETYKKDGAIGTRFFTPAEQYP